MFVKMGLFFVIILFAVLGSAHESTLNAEYIYLVQAEQWSGTGFAVQADNGKIFIVTNRHVCGFKNTPLVLIDYQGNQFPVAKRWLASNTDLCALEAPSQDIPSLKMAKKVEIGMKFTTSGYPLVQFMSEHSGEVIGFPSTPANIGHSIPEELSLEQCKGIGIILSEKDQKGKTFHYCKIIMSSVGVTDMVIGVGASGSPLIDKETNEVIGVIFGGKPLSHVLVLCSFIKIEALRAFLQAIP